jgi:hypothetical protein
LNVLGILYIEKDMIEHIDVDTINNNFASRNACTNYFVWILVLGFWVVGFILVK